MRRRRVPLLLLAVLCGNLLLPVAQRYPTPEVPVILVHGQGGSPELTWKTVVSRFEKKGYQPGKNLFAVDLSGTGNEAATLGVMADAVRVSGEIRRVLSETGATRVDLVGHSRGGLIVRFVAAGSMAPLIRRAVTLNTPHAGVLPDAAVSAIMDAAGVSPQLRAAVKVPEDLQVGSAALRTLSARERLAPTEVPVLAIGTTWQDGVPAVLRENDGAVPLASQLAWPGAVTRVFRLGPSAEELQTLLRSEMAPALLVWKSPHLQSLESTPVIDTVADFLLTPRVAPPLRPCGLNCSDRVLLALAESPRWNGIALLMGPSDLLQADWQ